MQAGLIIGGAIALALVWRLQKKGGLLGLVGPIGQPPKPSAETIPDILTPDGTLIPAPPTMPAPGQAGNLGGAAVSVSAMFISPQMGSVVKRYFFSASYPIEVELQSYSSQAVTVKLEHRATFHSPFGGSEYRIADLGTWTVPAGKVVRVKTSVHSGVSGLDLTRRVQPAGLYVNGQRVEISWYWVE